jgi:hypothetical protein
MNKTLSIILMVLAVLVLAGGIFFAGTIYARSSMMFGWGNNSTYGPGRMGQSGMMSGMMNRQGGMMNGYNNSNLTALTIDQAKAAAERYVQSLNIGGLEIGEVMVFDNNAYVIVQETETGLGAFELLVDPVSQVAYPEHGPNMMWNLKYSGLNHQFVMRNGGGMMGNYSWNSTTPADVFAEMTITPEQAIEYAQKYLNENISGASPATHASQFYGYYTIDFEKDGKILGMLSINGYDGQVFPHTWHGTFIEETE